MDEDKGELGSMMTQYATVYGVARYIEQNYFFCLKQSILSYQILKYPLVVHPLTSY